jgi:hypothetical protein
MPLARIDIPEGRAPEFRVAVGDVVYAAMTSTLDVPIGDRFKVICEHRGDRRQHRERRLPDPSLTIDQ